MTARQDDRSALLAFCDALDTRPSLLKPDEYSDWRLRGSHGHVYATPEAGAFYIYVPSPSRQAWTFAKRQTSFCEVSQDGDDEGILRIDRLPTKREAAVLRRLVGLPQRRRMPPGQKEAAIARLKSSRYARRGGE